MKGFKKIFNQLSCKHRRYEIIRVTDWFPTFEATNGLSDDEERRVTFQCRDCGKKKNRIQQNTPAGVLWVK